MNTIYLALRNELTVLKTSAGCQYLLWKMLSKIIQREVLAESASDEGVILLDLAMGVAQKEFKSTRPVASVLAGSLSAITKCLERQNCSEDAGFLIRI